MPWTFPDTFMSISKGNKQSIPFVQGKFNMGGTGALRFCSGPFHLQLVISRRNQAIADATWCGLGKEWGFTVVRRMDPRGARKSTEFEIWRRRSGTRVLSFTADELSLLPEQQSQHGPT